MLSKLTALFQQHFKPITRADDAHDYVGTVRAVAPTGSFLLALTPVVVAALLSHDEPAVGLAIVLCAYGVFSALYLVARFVTHKPTATKDDYSLRDLRAVADAFGLDDDSWSPDVKKRVVALVKSSVSSRIADAESDTTQSQRKALQTLVSFASVGPNRTDIHSTLELRALSERAGLSPEVIDGFEKTAILCKLKGAKDDVQQLSFRKVVRVAERLNVGLQPFRRDRVWDEVFKELRGRHARENNTNAGQEGTTISVPKTELDEFDLTHVPLRELSAMAKSLSVQCDVGGWDRRTKLQMINDIVTARRQQRQQQQHHKEAPTLPAETLRATAAPATVAAKLNIPSRGDSLPAAVAALRGEGMHQEIPKHLRERLPKKPEDPLDGTMSLRNLRELAKLYHVRCDVGGRERRTKRDIVADIDLVRRAGNLLNQEHEMPPPDVELEVFQDILDVFAPEESLESKGKDELRLEIVEKMDKQLVIELVDRWADPSDQDLIEKIAERRNLEYASRIWSMNAVKCRDEAVLRGAHPHLSCNDHCLKLLDCLVRDKQIVLRGSP